MAYQPKEYGPNNNIGRLPYPQNKRILSVILTDYHLKALSLRLHTTEIIS